MSSRAAPFPSVSRWRPVCLRIRSGLPLRGFQVTVRSSGVFFSRPFFT